MTELTPTQKTLGEIMEDLKRGHDREDEKITCRDCLDDIDKATSEIKSLIKEKLPTRDCPIILARNKRLQCKTCSNTVNKFGHCESKIRNQVLTEIEQILEAL